MKIVTLTRKNKIIKGEINLPASKSISNRALIINHLAKNQPRLHNLSLAGDTQLMARLLEKISTIETYDIAVELNCKNAGTVIRFLTALLANTTGNWILTGDARMKERPIGILVEALIQLGADINYLDKPGFPPIQIKGKTLKGGKINVDGSVSSQFISALLLIAPTLENGIYLTLTNKINSRPYIEMTLGLLKHFGINYTFDGNEINIAQQHFKARELFIEPDWSSAAYWFEMVALADEAEFVLQDLYPGFPSSPFIKSGLKGDRQSLQGDSILPEIYTSFGVHTEILGHGIRLTKKGKPVTQIEFDFTNHPDLAQSVIVTCAGLGIKGTFIGLESLRIKETDRLSALQTELQKLGFKTKAVRGSKFVRMDSFGEVRSWVSDNIRNNQSILRPIGIINTFKDHRMAMAFASLVMIFENITIENPEVVSKSYPNFWKDLKRVGIDISFGM